MKKKLFALLLVAALAIAAVALTACSGKEKDPAEAPTTAAAEGSPTEASVDATEAANTPAATLSELAAQLNEGLEEANAASGGMCTIKVTADGDKLVYSYTYAMELPGDMLQTSLDAAGEAYGGQVGAFKESGYGISAIVIQFLDQSGKVIASKDFK